MCAAVCKSVGADYTCGASSNGYADEGSRGTGGSYVLPYLPADGVTRPFTQTSGGGLSRKRKVVRVTLTRGGFGYGTTTRTTSVVVSNNVIPMGGSAPANSSYMEDDNPVLQAQERFISDLDAMDKDDSIRQQIEAEMMGDVDPDGPLNSPASEYRRELRNKTSQKSRIKKGQKNAALRGARRDAALDASRSEMLAKADVLYRRSERLKKKALEGGSRSAYEALGKNTGSYRSREDWDEGPGAPSRKLPRY